MSVVFEDEFRVSVLRLYFECCFEECFEVVWNVALRGCLRKLF